MYKYIKRFFDLVFGVLALVILSPILVPIAIVLKLTGEHHVFYLQRRIGFKNTHFEIYKFATMVKNSLNIGSGSITLRNDPRVLPIGKYLRKTKINELPQLINVLIGNMSIVGPRPLVDKTFDAYPENIRYKVYESVPGITGVGSVFFRDEEALISKSGKPPHEYYQDVIAPYKGALEMWYNTNKSLYVDFMLIFLTAWVILFPKSRLMFRIFRNLPVREF